MPLKKATFGLLYDQCSPMAFGLAMRMLRDQTEAEDVLQHAFLALWQHGDEFDPEKGRITTWVCSFVRHRCIDILRRRRISNHLPIEHSEEGVTKMDFPDGLPTPMEMSEINEQAHMIQRQLAMLPAEQRRVIEAAHFDGMTHQEMADSFGEPLGTIKTRMRLGLLKLSECLKKEVSVRP